MTERQPKREKPTAGFTLIEVLCATALMAIILAALAAVIAQWLPNWNRGMSRIQRNEHVALGLERLSADLAAAEYIPAHNQTPLPLFDGAPRQITFVRTAVGAFAAPGLEVVRIAEIGHAQGPMLVRSRAVFVPSISNLRALAFGDPVVVLRPPYRLSFAYSGKDRVWQNNWQQRPQLPAAVRLTLHDSARQKNSLSTAVLVHAELSIDCLLAKSLSECLNKPSALDQRDKSRI